MKTKVLTRYIVDEGMRQHIEKLSLQRDVEDKIIDGYYCALTGSHVQDCLERLLTNVQNNERRMHHDAYEGPGGCIIIGWALAYETDTVGQYLMRGKLKGVKKDGQVHLITEHPRLPQFSVNDPSFREAYHKLVGVMKAKLTREQLIESCTYPY